MRRRKILRLRTARDTDTTFNLAERGYKRSNDMMYSTESSRVRTVVTVHYAGRPHKKCHKRTVTTRGDGTLVYCVVAASANGTSYLQETNKMKS